MRYLVISDLHSNFEALHAVLTDAQGLYDQIVCLGDLTGYGPDPNRVVDWVRANVATVIRGNHDRACAGLEDLEWFNPIARAATVWTIAALTPENRSWLEALPRGPLPVEPKGSADGAGFVMVHGSPLDEDEYLISVFDARNVFSYLETNIVLFGHTHLQGIFTHSNGRYDVVRRPESSEQQTMVRLERDGAYLINPGSVGQPRDSDPRAAYAVFDTAQLTVSLRRVAYDHEATRRRIQAAGLPEVLGERLALGR